MNKLIRNFLLIFLYFFVFNLNLNIVRADDLTESNDIFEEIEVNDPIQSEYDTENYSLIEGNNDIEAQEKLKSHTKAISDQQLGKGVYLEGLNDNILMSTINSTFCRLAGGSSCLIKTTDGTSYNPYGPNLAQGVSKAIAYTFIPPANGTRYIADGIKNFGSPQKTYAQGLGFNSLNPLLPIWKLFRNLAYVFFTIFSLVVGFMILFRQKIDGQTSVSVQQAIPSILVALVLVTFSYAIAGLMIDLMWFSIYFMTGFFTNIDPALTSMSVFGLAWKLLVSGSTDSFQLLSSMVQNAWAPALAWAVGFIGGLTMALVVAVVILIGCFKLFFSLLKSYISVIISIVFSPLLLMMHAIPGKKPLGTWAKSILSNLACFPLVFLLLIMHDVLTNTDGSFSAQGGFIPPYLIGSANMASGAIGAILGLSIILTLPDIIKQIREKFGGDQSFFAQFGDLAIKNVQSGAKSGHASTAGMIGGGALGGAFGVFNGISESAKGPKGFRNRFKSFGGGFADSVKGGASFGEIPGRISSKGTSLLTGGGGDNLSNLSERAREYKKLRKQWKNDGEPEPFKKYKKHYKENKDNKEKKDNREEAYR